MIEIIKKKKNITVLFLVGIFLFYLSPVSVAEALDKDFIVGKENKITVGLTGPYGYTGGLGSEVEEVVFDYYFPEKPEGNFYAEETASLLKDLKNTGKTDVIIYSDTAGQVDVVFAFKIIYKENVKPTRLLTNQFTFNFVPQTEKKTLALMYIGSEDNPSPYTAQIIDGKVFLPLDITMQILNIENPPLDQLNIIKIDEIDFITVGAGFHASPELQIKLDDCEIQLGVEKIFDKNGNISGIKIVQYTPITNVTQ